MFAFECISVSWYYCIRIVRLEKRIAILNNKDKALSFDSIETAL